MIEKVGGFTTPPAAKVSREALIKWYVEDLKYCDKKWQKEAKGTPAYDVWKRQVNDLNLLKKMK